MIDHLLSVAEVTSIVGQKIGSKLPKNVSGSSFPRLVVTRIGGSPGPIPHHIDEARVQVDCWADDVAGGKKVAMDLARTTQAALYDMVNETHDEAVVTDVRGVLGPVWVPDPPTGRPRYLVDMLVRVHPIPSS